MTKNNDNWLHDLFINEAKPATRRHSGSGSGPSVSVKPLSVTENGTFTAPDGQAYSPVDVAVTPTVEPITITENGVYPVPKGAGGVVEIGKEYRFKDVITEADFECYASKATNSVEDHGATIYLVGMTHEEGSKYELQLIHMAIPDTDTNVWLLMLNQSTGFAYGINASLVDPDMIDNCWMGNAEKAPIDTPTITLDECDTMSADLATTAIFFDIETKSLDGWGDITVNVAGGGAEFNIAYGDTAPEDTSKLWVKTTQPSKVKVASGLVLEKETLTKLSVTPEVGKKGSVVSSPINNKIYIVGGSNEKTIRYFDITTQTFGKISATTSFQNSNKHAIMTFGSKLYIFGGYGYINGGWNNLSGIYCVDVETDTFTTLGVTFPEARYEMGWSTVGNKCYLFGGWAPSENPSKAIYCFDAETETLSRLSTELPSASSRWSAAADGNIIYLITTPYIANGTGTNEILAFDTETNVISVKSKHAVNDSGSSRIYSNAVNVYRDGYLYLLGIGYDTNSKSYYVIVNVEDGTHTYSEQTFDCIGTGGAGAVVDDLVYIFYRSFVSIFKLPKDVLVDPNTLQLLSTLDRNVFKFINTDNVQVEMGVNNVYKGNNKGIGEQVEAALYNGTQWVNI
jgi:hypothetical protein